MHSRLACRMVQRVAFLLRGVRYDCRMLLPWRSSSLVRDPWRVIERRSWPLRR